MSAQDIFGEIQASHLEGNVPSNTDFLPFLKRDLAAYFKGMSSRPITVEYDFLRNGATQSGISYPKFYLWVTVSANKKLLTQGAIRVAAIDKKRFDVTNFLSVANLQKSLRTIEETFPLPVGAKVRERLKKIPVAKTKP